MDSIDYTSEVLHPEAVAWMLTQLDERARDEFIDGIAKRLHRLEQNQHGAAEDLVTSSLFVSSR